MAADTSFLLIGALAKKANTTKDTVRHYDQLGLLKSRKRQAGSRLYTEFHPECVERIELIKRAQAVGFTLNEMQDGFNDFYAGKMGLDEQLSFNQKKLEQVQKQQENTNIMIALLTEDIKELKKLKSIQANSD